MPEPLGSDYVMVFHDSPGDGVVATTAPSSGAFGKREWFILGAFAAVAAGVGGLAWWSSRESGEKWGFQPGTRITRGARLDFVYQEGCVACSQTDEVLEQAIPLLEKLGVRVRQVKADTLPASWPVNKTPSLLLRTGGRTYEMTEPSREAIINSGKEAALRLAKWAQRKLKK